jgi:hypothetical protein
MAMRPDFSVSGKIEFVAHAAKSVRRAARDRSPEQRTSAAAEPVEAPSQPVCKFRGRLGGRNHQIHHSLTLTKRSKSNRIEPPLIRCRRLSGPLSEIKSNRRRMTLHQQSRFPRASERRARPQQAKEKTANRKRLTETVFRPSQKSAMHSSRRTQNYSTARNPRACPLPGWP